MLHHRLDKSQFVRKLRLLAIRVPQNKVGLFVQRLRGYVHTWAAAAGAGATDDDVGGGGGGCPLGYHIQSKCVLNVFTHYHHHYHYYHHYYGHYV